MIDIIIAEKYGRNERESHIDIKVKYTDIPLDAYIVKLILFEYCL